ncbi:hypothetical protein BZA77DRAFT_305474 [Pyronema omphalodes]|nr:hypothetical protein BZA77DRAFT_305474 [Pyronema omphalodes]
MQPTQNTATALLLFLTISFIPIVQAAPGSINYARMDDRDREYNPASVSNFWFKLPSPLKMQSPDLKSPQPQPIIYEATSNSDNIICQKHCGRVHEVGDMKWRECRRCCRGGGGAGVCIRHGGWIGGEL